MLPCAGLLEKLSMKLIPEPKVADGRDRINELDERLMITPAVAIQRCRVVTEKMANISKISLYKALDQLNVYSEDVCKEIVDEENRVAEIGYVLNPDFWGMGLATEAAAEVIKFGFETMNMHRIEAKFMFGNDASLAVMRKLGMKFEGYQRDLLFVKGRYSTICTASILKSEYYN